MYILPEKFLQKKKKKINIDHVAKPNPPITSIPKAVE